MLKGWSEGESYNMGFKREVGNVGFYKFWKLGNVLSRDVMRLESS